MTIEEEVTALVFTEHRICGLCDKREGKTIRRGGVEFTVCAPCAGQFNPDYFLAHAMIKCEQRKTLRKAETMTPKGNDKLWRMYFNEDAATAENRNQEEAQSDLD